MKGNYEFMRKKEGAERRPEGARTLQTAMWVCLILAQLTVVNCLETRAATQERQVEKTIEYRNLEGTAAIPEVLNVDVTEAGQTVSVPCSRQECRILEERWIGDFEFPLTFHSYDSDYYVCGERLIPHSEEQPDLAGCESDLLDMIGVSPEEYRIETVGWRGAAYEGEDGTLCRDAMARGSRLVRDYEARYVGVASFTVQERPLVPEVRSEASSEAETAVAEMTVPVEERSQTVAESVQVRLPEEELPAEPAPRTLWQRITDTMLLAVGLGAILFFGGLLLLAALRLEKKAKAWYTERKQRREIQSDVYREQKH